MTILRGLEKLNILRTKFSKHPNFQYHKVIEPLDANPLYIHSASRVNMSQQALNTDFSNLERINQRKLNLYTHSNARTPYTNYNFMGIHYAKLLLYTQRFLLEKHNETKVWANDKRGREPFPYNESLRQNQEVVGQVTSFNQSANNSQLSTMTRLNGIEWDAWNKDMHDLSEVEMVSCMGQLDDYWFAMVDQMLNNQDDKQRYCHIDQEQDSYKKDNIARETKAKTKKEDISGDVVEESLHKVLNDIYKTDIQKQNKIVEQDTADFNKAVWESDESKSNTQYHDRNLAKDKNVSIIDKEMYNDQAAINKFKDTIDKLELEESLKKMLSFYGSQINGVDVKKIEQNIDKITELLNGINVQADEYYKIDSKFENWDKSKEYALSIREKEIQLRSLLKK